MLSDTYITVSDLNRYLKTYLENNYFLQEIFIKGEISNFKRHQSGTFYFAIKDDTSRVSVVMFPMFANRVLFPLKDGDMVLIKGRINVYEANGTYSIQASEILFDSIGMLYVRYEELKKKLEENGVFSMEHKKPLPKYPNTIGIITAPYGAAIHDMVRTLMSRWPIAKVILFPSLVQGKDAADDLVRNIQRADQYGVDVIICGRGGGSIEDLWPFNEERVAMAIYHCKTPIISAVGHQNDFTIADFVADVRALTPTDGAVKATPSKDELYQLFIKEKALLINQFAAYLANYQNILKRYKESYIFKNPISIYEKYRYQVDDFENRLENAFFKLKQFQKEKISILSMQLKHNMVNYTNKSRSTFQNFIARLDNLSPLKVLNRGYSFATVNNHVIQSVEDVQINDVMVLDVADGFIESVVKGRSKKK